MSSKVEMMSFTQQNSQAELTWSWLMAFLLLFINSILGETFGLAFGWHLGLAVGLGLVPFEFGFIGRHRQTFICDLHVWVCGNNALNHAIATVISQWIVLAIH